MKICDEFWDEFMRWAIPMNKFKDDADIYDVFIWIRNNRPGAIPLSDSLIARVDKEIEREIARESRRVDSGNKRIHNTDRC